jgi:4'-phosphopantetheinyl transferase
MRNIDVCLTFYDELSDERLLSQLRQLLTDAEREQEPRFYFADDRKRYLVTRALVRTVLSRYAAVAPADWVFAKNRYGRPEIANVGGVGRDLCFNISHTRGLIALGVARGRALGIDVENISTRSAPIDIAEHFFARTEAAELSRLPLDRQPDRFFEYWTFKESYIKARGMGLSIPLDQFSFEFPHQGGVRLAIEPELGDRTSRWCFWQFRPRPEYQLALCAERVDHEAPRLTIRRIVPTVLDEVLDLRVLRTSEC